MAVFNRDTDLQQALADELDKKSSELENNIDELKQLLDAMKNSAVFDDNSTAAIDRILGVVEKLHDPAVIAKENAQKIARQAQGGKDAAAKLDEIAI